MGTKLYVGNLSFRTTNEDLQEFFGQAGVVTSANIITDRQSGFSRGFGFVEMGSDDEATSAISMFNGQALDGRNITVNEARPRDERSDGGNYGGGEGRRNFSGGRGNGGRGGRGGRSNDRGNRW